MFLVARWNFHLPLSPIAIGVAGFFVLLTNLGLTRLVPLSPSPGVLGAVLSLDIVLLTMVLAAYGGHTNPFTLLYLLHVVLAILLLPKRGAWIVGGFCIVGYLFNFFFYVPLAALSSHDGHNHGFSLHLQGMLIAFVAVTIALASVVAQIRAKLDAHERRRIEAEDHERQLSTLTALAASTAHDLGTPLSTIAVLASDLSSASAFNKNLSEFGPDLELLQCSVTRCHDILERMHLQAGSLRGEVPSEGSLKSAVTDAVQDLSCDERVRVTADISDSVIHTPQKLFRYALTCLIRNALEASNEAVRIESKGDRDRVELSVVDSGRGMPHEVRERIGTPFNSSKGSGRGLGIFLTNLFARGVGGALRFEARTPAGTRAVLVIPRRTTWSERSAPIGI